MDNDTKFLQGLLELQYGRKVQSKLKKLSLGVAWAKDWPMNNISFWNAEAFMWGHKIDKDKRELIARELSFLQGKRNLDLGCGSYSYLPSVGFDLSPKMLQFNTNLLERVSGDLEKSLPFKTEEFESVTAVFVLNYVKNHLLLLKEIKRVLKPRGWFVMVLYSKPINDWQRQKEVSSLSSSAWIRELKKSGFNARLKLKDKLYFFKCRKLY